MDDPQEIFQIRESSEDLNIKDYLKFCHPVLPHNISSLKIGRKEKENRPSSLKIKSLKSIENLAYKNSG